MCSCKLSNTRQKFHWSSRLNLSHQMQQYSACRKHMLNKTSPLFQHESFCLIIQSEQVQVHPPPHPLLWLGEEGYSSSDDIIWLKRKYYNNNEINPFLILHILYNSLMPNNNTCKASPRLGYGIAFPYPSSLPFVSVHMVTEFY